MCIRNRVENLVTNNGEKYTYNHSKYRWQTRKLKAEKESKRYEDIKVLYNLRIIIGVLEQVF